MGEANPGVPPSSGGSSVKLNRVELRRHPRFRANEAAAQLYLKGFLTRIGIGKKNEAKGTVNLSEGGILVVMNQKHAAQTKVQVRVEIEKFNDVIEVDGVVRWCFQSARDGADYYAGIEFLNLKPAQATLIAKMRDWFTSPEYKQKNATRRRLAPPEFQI